MVEASMILVLALIGVALVTAVLYWLGVGSKRAEQDREREAFARELELDPTRPTPGRLAADEMFRGRLELPIDPADAEWRGSGDDGR
jgi:hypothetical protein